jgi:hypothetical protein
MFYLGPVGGFNRDLLFGIVCCLIAINLFGSIPLDDDDDVDDDDLCCRLSVEAPPNSESSGFGSSERFFLFASHFSASRSIDP